MTPVFPQLERQLMDAAASEAPGGAARRRWWFLRGGGLPLLAGAVLVSGSAAAATGLWTPLASSPPPARAAIVVAKERLAVLRHGPDVQDDPALARIERLARRLSGRAARGLPAGMVSTNRIPEIDRARLARVDGRYRTFVLSGPRAICIAQTVTRSTVGSFGCDTRAEDFELIAGGRLQPSAMKVVDGWLLSVIVPDGTRDAALTYADERVQPVAIRGNVVAVVVADSVSPTALTWTAPDGSPQRAPNPVPTIPPLPPHP